MHFISMNPLTSECAVGINAGGDEWNEAAAFMAANGADRVVGLDYSKYDLRMPAQLTHASASIFLTLAKWTGNYSQRDLKIMNSMFYEVTNPLVAYNGDMIRFLGTNPSGQNATVYTNSIVNSLLHRIAFFEQYPTQESFGEAGVKLRAELGRDIRFRDASNLLVYGDDAKESVKEGFDKYNHLTIASKMAAGDMKVTMPDKKATPTAFMNDADCDFLKRKNRFEPALGVTVGVLDENSIFKSLHSILKSKAVTPLEVSSSNIDGALHEWFFHGKDIYEMRREQMKEIAHNTGCLCRTLNLTFEDRVEEWKNKYGN
jgi:hypothetical protein